MNLSSIIGKLFFYIEKLVLDEVPLFLMINVSSRIFLIFHLICLG